MTHILVDLFAIGAMVFLIYGGILFLIIRAERRKQEKNASSFKQKIIDETTKKLQNEFNEKVNWLKYEILKDPKYLAKSDYGENVGIVEFPLLNSLTYPDAQLSEVKELSKTDLRYVYRFNRALQDASVTKDQLIEVVAHKLSKELIAQGLINFKMGDVVDLYSYPQSGVQQITAYISILK